MAPPRRRWLSFALRAARLAARPREETAARVRRSYDRIAPGYDQVWTDHMRDLSLALLDRLGDVRGAEAADLCCGTGFVSGALAERTGREVIAVDASAGMLEVARSRHPGCRFEEGDAVAWLRARPPASLDLVVSAWALGYARPWALLRAARRALRPGGRLAVLDNTLRSLSEIVWTSVLTFAERPAALDHVMRVGFLPSSRAAAALLRAAGLRPRQRRHPGVRRRPCQRRGRRQRRPAQSCQKDRSASGWPSAGPDGPARAPPAPQPGRSPRRPRSPSSSSARPPSLSITMITGFIRMPPIQQLPPAGMTRLPQ